VCRYTPQAIPVTSLLSLAPLRAVVRVFQGMYTSHRTRHTAHVQGMYTAPFALALYAEAFEQAGALQVRGTVAMPSSLAAGGHCAHPHPVVWYSTWRALPALMGLLFMACLPTAISSR
jgi:hypothetical protein